MPVVLYYIYVTVFFPFWVVDYLAYPGIYKIGSQRGCTVISFAPDGSFDCKAESYYQDKYEKYLDDMVADIEKCKISGKRIVILWFWKPVWAGHRMPPI